QDMHFNLYRQQVEKDLIEQSKYRCVGADAEGQRKNRDKGKNRRLRQRPDGVTQFSEKVHQRLILNIGTILAYKIPGLAPPGLFARKPSRPAISWQYRRLRRAQVRRY